MTADLVQRLRDSVRSARALDRSALLAEAADEIERLRFAIRRIAEQDATLSACDRVVTVTMDATLTDAEREAVEVASRFMDKWGGVPNTIASDTLRGLLERTK